MKIDGEVKTGLGFVPYPGTLNVVVSDEYLDEINEKKDSCQNIIKPDEGFGAVKYIEAVLNDEVKGAIVFPAKTTHDENYLEFIAEARLRDELNLEDGDIVSIEF